MCRLRALQISQIKVLLQAISRRFTVQRYVLSMKNNDLDSTSVLTIRVGKYDIKNSMYRKLHTGYTKYRTNHQLSKPNPKSMEQKLLHLYKHLIPSSQIKPPLRRMTLSKTVAASC